jgi:hypothetical protein
MIGVGVWVSVADGCGVGVGSWVTVGTGDTGTRVIVGCNWVAVATGAGWDIHPLSSDPKMIKRTKKCLVKFSTPYSSVLDEGYERILLMTRRDYTLFLR